MVPHILLFDIRIIDTSVIFGWSRLRIVWDQGKRRRCSPICDGYGRYKLDLMLRRLCIRLIVHFRKRWNRFR